MQKSLLLAMYSVKNLAIQTESRLYILLKIFHYKEPGQIYFYFSIKRDEALAIVQQKMVVPPQTIQDPIRY